MLQIQHYWGVTSVVSDVLGKLPIVFCLHRVLGERLGYNVAMTSAVFMLHDRLWFNCNLCKTTSSNWACPLLTEMFLNEALKSR